MAFLRMSALLVFATAVLFRGVATAEPAGQLDIARKTFQLARNGDTAAVESAGALFGNLVKQYPKRYLLRSYLGACRTMEGRDAWAPWTKMRATEDGLDLIDRALMEAERSGQGEPLDRLETKFVAASVFLSVPDLLFHRAANGKQLLKEVVKDEEYATAPQTFKDDVGRTLKEATE